MKAQTIIVGAVMFVIGVMIGYLGGSSTTVQTAQGPTATTTTTETASTNNVPTQNQLMDIVVESTRHFKGDPDAPVTIVEFSDFQCPYCSRFAVDAGQQIDEHYIENGVVRFGYQHFVFLGEASNWAAEASECAAEQDAFWPYHDRLVEWVAIEQQRGFSKDQLKQFASELELDTEAFHECLDSGRYTDLVQQETAIAQGMGVQSTPTFLINGQPLMGAQPFENFQRIIDSMHDS
ncbi:MAG: DsbA family protein [Chloroflexaceae bacterium]|nr:DsbA family protein [Chloroflexaceae bacterium]